MLEMNKGDKVILKGFTGIKLGVFPVASTTKKTVTVLKKNGDEMVFDRKTGKQINVEEGKEKYANSIIPDDGSFVAPSTAGAKRKSTKKATKAKVEAEDETDEDEAPVKKSTKKAVKKTAPLEEDIDEEEDDEDEDDEPVAKKPVKKSKKPAKKSKKVVEDEDDEDDDEFEEVDD